MRILLLCHTSHDDLMACPSGGLPVTRASLADMTTVDKAVGADHRIDWTKPMHPAQVARLRGRFDVVATRCCAYNVFFSPSEGVNTTALSNAAIALRKGGLLLMSAPAFGYAMVHKAQRTRGRGNVDTGAFVAGLGEARMKKLDELILSTVEANSGGLLRRVIGTEHHKAYDAIYRRYMGPRFEPADKGNSPWDVHNVLAFRRT